MAGRKKSSFRKKVEAVAKVEATAKAVFKRTKNISEVVPPDVTRAKAGAWLDLLSPITEWAGLKGDALRHKRGLLRIQQEETLFRVAQGVRQKLGDANEVKTIPMKILVPAVEKASLEEAADDVMVDRWASLLASAAEQVDVQPRFVGILGELAGSQAECLERLAFNNYSESIFPDAEFEESPLMFADYNIRQPLQDGVAEALIAAWESKDPIESTNEMVDEIVSALSRPGVKVLLVFMKDSDGYIWGHDSVAATGVREESDMSVLESLGLVRHAAVEFEVPHAIEGKSLRVSVYYHHLTLMGVDFCKVCSRSRYAELEKIGNAARAKKLSRKGSIIGY